jgi:hypothetical protein
MKRTHLVASMLFSTLVGGCGGGSAGTDAAAPSSVATYNFARPNAGAHLVYSEKLTERRSRS